MWVRFLNRSAKPRLVRVPTFLNRSVKPRLVRVPTDSDSQKFIHKIKYSV
ncbi:hypothetical protein LEP1GSC079_2407 [Leptospira interrogans str. FPW1039]|uniref:Uncharacterized protein n=1 Tax=Leptospira interrogans str. FPW1039 TaxID=1193040 RepID=A0A0F6IKV6_LEPIR|nr:hypothetical protein LEP1GSC099_2683 [Leptospira interrogans str. UI 08452]EMJ38681.1 hypothetical protein LEP1GSC079_2407 [Leptospira interrogans str. FPW1039]EMN35858.1 hypothetical protein LEP1GSC084_3748 [Leptospira interrogans serovar Medanensis str. L0448]EMN38442.1 hypothetical protein LEP1GSC085_3461 [Leptospira interrogans str. L0996]